MCWSTPVLVDACADRRGRRAAKAAGREEAVAILTTYKLVMPEDMNLYSVDADGVKCPING